MRIAVYSNPLPADMKHWLEEDWLTYEILIHLVREHPEEDWVWLMPYFDTSQNFQPDNLPVISWAKKSPGAIAGYIGLNRKLPALLRKQQVDVLLSLEGLLPSDTIPSCLLLRHLSAESASGKKRDLLRQLGKANALATLSHHEKKILTTEYHIPAEKITTIHRSVHADFRPLDWEEREQVKTTYTDSKEYFIYTGDIAEQKNIVNLLKGFSILKKRLRSNMVLVLAGDLHKSFREFPELLRTYYFKNDVKWIKEITLQERTRLIGAAYGLICPFTPDTIRPELLEAFACRVPVIAADNPLTRETGEDAVIYCNPLNVETIGNVLCEIYKDEDLRARLIALGDIQAKKYSWDKTCTLLWSTLKDAATQEK